MPVISRYSCNERDFELPSGWGGYTYAVDNSGRRVVCPHPGEFHTIHQVTGLSYTEAREAGRVGFAQHCVCLDCLKQIDLDLERDAVVCPECSSAQVRSLRDLIGQKCPRCRVGIIEEGSLVRWKIDPDWERLPVPQVVKDLTEFAENRQVPVSLRRAAEVADTFGKHNFFTVAVRLLGWWEGDYFSKDQEQQDSTEMRPQWTWCKALPLVLEATPALAELVSIRGGRCWFAEGVSQDVRWGIKNYLRKHRTHVVMS
jgi:hypothetical protein